MLSGGGGVQGWGVGCDGFLMAFLNGCVILIFLVTLCDYVIYRSSNMLCLIFTVNLKCSSY